MTRKNFILFSILQWLILAAIKYWFFTRQIFGNPGWQSIALWVLTGIIIVAIVRRFGVINYIEAFFLMFLWTVGNLFLDLALLSNYTGTSIFYKPDYWASLLVLNVGIFVFHKKRHVAVRHMLHAKKLAEEHAHEHNKGH
jgi:hypothetical protein